MPKYNVGLPAVAGLGGWLLAVSGFVGLSLPFVGVVSGKAWLRPWISCVSVASARYLVWHLPGPGLVGLLRLALAPASLARFGLGLALAP